jgi:hypothetical protein
MTTPHFAAAYEKLGEMSMKLDSTKYKSQAIQAWTFLTKYYNDTKKDTKTAISYLDRILQVDPANAFALQFRPILQKALNKPAPSTAPKRSGSSSTSTKATASKQGASK